MKAGIELDALIAEKIFGEKYEYHNIFKDYCREWVEDPIAYETCPRYSTDIGAAWAVVEKLLTIIPNQDFHIEHWSDEGSSGWQVNTCFQLGESTGWVRESDLPHAICIAALKAVS